MLRLICPNHRKLQSLRKSMATAKDLIRKIQLHEDLKYWVMQQLQAEGIECQEQDFYEEKGDILIVKVEDVPRSLEIIQEIKKRIDESVY